MHVQATAVHWKAQHRRTERCNLKCDHLMSLCLLEIIKYYTGNLEVVQYGSKGEALGTRAMMGWQQSCDRKFTL